jgi:hypothetical protein
MGIWYYLICPEHREFLFLGSYILLEEGVMELRERKQYDPSGVAVDWSFIEKYIVPVGGVGLRKFLEKHRDCRLLLGDDTAMDYIFDDFTGWLEYYTDREEPSVVE